MNTQLTGKDKKTADEILTTAIDDCMANVVMYLDENMNIEANYFNDLASHLTKLRSQWPFINTLN